MVGVDMSDEVRNASLRKIGGKQFHGFFGVAVPLPLRPDHPRELRRTAAAGHGRLDVSDRLLARTERDDEIDPLLGTIAGFASSLDRVPPRKLILRGRPTACECVKGSIRKHISHLGSVLDAKWP